MKKTKFRLILWIVFYIFVFAWLLYNSFAYLDPDFGWHIRIGEQIIKEKSAPFVDYYNYPVGGAKWIDHEWLFNAILNVLYNLTGYIGISILFALLVIATLILLNWFANKFFGSKNRPAVLMALQFLGVLAMSHHLGVRLQEITLLFLLLQLIIIKIYSRDKRPLILLWLSPLYMLWANLHGSYLIGFVLMAIWLAAKTAETWLPTGRFSADPKLVLSSKEIAGSIPFFVLAFLSTLINPYGLDLYSYLSGLKNPFYLKHIVEWLPAYFLPINYFKLIYASILTTFSTFYVIEYYKNSKQKTPLKQRPINFFYFTLILLFLYMSFNSKRHFPLLFIVSFPVLSYILQYFFNLPDSIKKYFEENFLLRIFIILGLFSATIYLFLTTNFTSQPFENPKYCETYPCAALKLIKNDDRYKNLRIFNTYGWGGYMLWIWPEKQIFIDGRMTIYNLEKTTLLEEYYSFFDPSRTELKLDEYNIELILLRINQPFKVSWFEKYVLGVRQNNDKSNTMIDFLSTSPDWKEIYLDGLSTIYVRHQ